MKGQNRLLVIIVAFLLLFSAGCSKEMTLNEGKIKGAIYKNDYLGLTMQIPNNWQVHDKKTMEQLRKEGRQRFNGEEGNNKVTHDDANPDDTIYLLSMSKYTSETEPRVSFVSFAEKLSNLTFAKNSRDYLLITKADFESDQVPATFEKDIYSEKIDGIEFNVLEIKLHIDNVTCSQKCYATNIKEYMYVFILTYNNQDDLKNLSEIIGTMKFTKEVK